MELSEGLAGRPELNQRTSSPPFSIIAVSFRIMANAIPPATLIWSEPPLTRGAMKTCGIRCDRASLCDEEWETAMLEMITHLFAAGLLSGCTSMGFGACNVPPAPTDPSRLRYALEHQPRVTPNECFVLGTDYVWRACQGGQLVPVLRR